MIDSVGFGDYPGEWESRHSLVLPIWNELHGDDELVYHFSL